MVKGLPLMIERAGVSQQMTKKELCIASEVFYLRFLLEDTIKSSNLHGSHLGDWYNKKEEVCFIADQGILF